MDPLYGTQLTDQLMANPWMLDPTQKANRFSPYQNTALPYPMSYNTGAGGPVNAATGQPIQSYQQWAAQNPGGTTLNNTPAQTQATSPNQGQFNTQMLNAMAQNLQGSGGGSGSLAGPALGNIVDMRALNSQMYPQGPGATGTPAAAPQGGGPPNNWGAALNALSNPGTPQIGGATAPLASGYQPAGGVNQAFLQQAQGRPNMNPNFLSALSAIQGRPQQ